MSLEEELSVLGAELRALVSETALDEEYEEGLEEGYTWVVTAVAKALGKTSTALSEVLEAIKLMKAERDALLKDKERMDWLAKNDDAMFDLQSRMNARSFREAVDLSMEEMG